jgi:hypothetical protein
LRAGGVALPSGVTFTDNGNGTGTLAGTPAASTGGTYAITFTGTNAAGSSPAQAFTLTVNQAPAITSANNATFVAGQAGSFTVTTSGFPAPSIARGGVLLPSGITFTDNGNGTGTLAGTPAAATGGTYAISFTATNVVGSSPAQAFTLSVNELPVVTSANNATFTVGQAGTFTVTTTGFPTPSIARGGVALPSGVTFTDNGNGTGTLAGTPGAGTGGTYAITFTGTNAAGSSPAQAFTLTVNQAPAITSANNATFIVGQSGSFTVTTSGFPAPSIARGGVALPSGVTFTDNGNGTATLAGTPAAATGGTYAITFTATNVVGSSPAQGFTLTVNQAPAITSANNATFTINQAGTFTVTTTGFPTNASMLITVPPGSLPTGVSFVNNNNGTATLSGTPTISGTFVFTITANNGVTPNATQGFTLTVQSPPAINSANNATFIVGASNTFSVTTTGTPTVTSIVRGGVSLPSGVTFTYTSGANGTLAGTPPTIAAVGLYNLSFTASNGVTPDAVQSPFTLTVACPVIAVTPTTLTNAILEQAYGPVTFAATGGSGSYAFSLGSGSPPGLAFTGANLGGTPTTAGTYTFDVIATDTATGCTGAATFSNFQVVITANNDNYGNIVGNVLVDSSSGAPFSVVSNDVIPASATITAFDATSALGGTVSMTTSGPNIGRFTYNPPRGRTGADSFTYTVTAGTASATATVSFNIVGMAWFIDNTRRCGFAAATAQDDPVFDPCDVRGASTRERYRPAEQRHDLHLHRRRPLHGRDHAAPGPALHRPGGGCEPRDAGRPHPGVGQTLPRPAARTPTSTRRSPSPPVTRCRASTWTATPRRSPPVPRPSFVVSIGRFRRTGTTSNAILLAGAGNTGTTASAASAPAAWSAAGTAASRSRTSPAASACSATTGP